MEMNAPDVSIRTIKAGDYDDLVGLWSACGSGFDPRGRESCEALARHIEQFAQLSFAAISRGQFVGVVLGTHDGRKGWINRLAVRPEFRRRGIAETLVRACDAAIRAEGIEIVAALVESDNQPSAAMFRKLGYSDAIEVRYFRKVSQKQA